MATWLKQSADIEIKLGPFVDQTDGFTPEDGLTIAQADVRLAKNAGDWAQKAEITTLVHEENGWYRCLLNTTDTATLGILIIAVNESGALPVWREFLVVAANVYDSLLGGGDLLQVDATQWAGEATATDDIALKATLAKGTDITGFNDLTAAAVNAEVDTAIADARLDELLAADSDIDGIAPPTVGSVIHELLTKTAGSFTYDQTSDSLEALRDNLALATAVADVQSDTDDIQSRLPTALVGGRIDASVGAVANDAITAAAIANGAIDAAAFATGAIDAAALNADAAGEIADAVWDEDIVAAHGTANAAGRALRTLDAIGDRTNNSNLNALLGVVDGAGVDVPSQVTDEVWDEVLTGATHNVATSAGRRLRTVDTITLNDDTATAGAADSITLAASASTTAGLYVGCLIVIDGGTGAGQSRYIVGYTAGRVAYVSRHWAVTPNGTSTYIVYGDNQVAFIHMGLAQAGGASSIQLASDASAIDDIYNGQQIRIMSGLGDDQIRLITDYDQATQTATVSPPWTVVPDGTSYYATCMAGVARVDAMSAGVVTATAIAANAIDADALAADAANEIADAHLDRAAAVDGLTPREVLRVEMAALAGKSSGGPGSPVYRAVDDSKARITAVATANGDRTVVTIDATP